MAAQKWVLFDVGGVLEAVDDDAWQDEWWRRWSGRAGIEDVGLDSLIVTAELPPIDLVSGRAEEFWQRLGDAMGLSGDDRAAMRADFWDAYCGEGNDGLIEYARGLAGRAGRAILSNSADGAREEEERRFGFSAVFDPICYSHEQGVNKPDPRAYLLALERMGAEPGEVFFVDDREESIAGAASVGVRGILHRGNAETIAAVEAFLRAE
ncbi:HAD-IA family hydrolase [Microbacterium sp.]|uniref:HAD family hydrolase n=1 Tax=Microbacterium sp. TaxID=51671 RepID=UPI00333EEDBA